MLSDINEEGLEETRRQVAFREVEVHLRKCNVAERDQVFELVEAAERELGYVDFMANNAGVAVGGPFHEITDEDWRWIVDINMWGVVYGCQAVVPGMRARGRGYILNVASAAGLLNPPKMAPYNLTKAAVISLSETLSAEYADEGIKASALCPTFFRTSIAASARGSNDPADRRKVEKVMDRSRKQAPEVAREAIDGTLAGVAHIQPMIDGRAMWAAKRAAPERFGGLLRLAARRGLLR